MANDDLQFFQRQVNGRSTILQADASRKEKIEQQLANKRLKHLREAAAEEKAIYQQLAQQKAAIELNLSNSNSSIEAATLRRNLDAVSQQMQQKQQIVLQTERNIAEKEAEIKQAATTFAINYEQQQYSMMTVRKRAEYQASMAENVRAAKEAAEMEAAAYEAAGNRKAAADAAARAAELAGQEKLARAESARLTNAIGGREGRQLRSAAIDKRAEDAHLAMSNAKANVSVTKSDVKNNLQNVVANNSAVITAEKKLQDVRASGNKQDLKAAKKALEDAKKNAKKLQSYRDAQAAGEEALANARIERNNALFVELGESAAKFGKDAVASLAEAGKNLMANGAAMLTNHVDGALNEMFAAQGRINTRLMGTSLDYAEIVDTISDNIGMGGVVSQKAVVAKMVELADSGVAYNLELRAFLAATAENIASTFDAFDSNLLRLIRIQQADTTAARMGMEQTLTSLFNKYFDDSSYMTRGGAADSVTASIIDAMSQMTRDNALSFEYTLQKWLGALYSLGLSDEAVNTIATGINYLGTGNVGALNSNDALQNLLAMSAAKSGQSYANLLTTGIDAKETNDLLKGMIEYLAEISKNQKNMVTKSAYSDLFGMSITDLTAFQQLTSEEIEKLYQSNVEYNDMIETTQTMLSTISSRMNVSTLIDTAMDNAMTSAAVDIGKNPALYGTWKVLNIIEDLTGGIAIPAVEVYGFMVDLHTTVTALAKSGIAGLSLMSNLLGGLFGGDLFGTLALSDWGYEEYGKRGKPMEMLFDGSASGVSESGTLTMVGSASGDDLKQTSMSDASDEATEDAGTSSEEMEEQREINEDIYKSLANSESDTVISQLHIISNTLDQTKELLNKDRVFYTSMSGLIGTSSTVSNLLSRYNNATFVEATDSISNINRESLLHNIASATSTLVNETKQNAESSGSASSSNETMSLSDVILQAVSAAMIAVSNDLTFHAEVSNSITDPLHIRSTTT